MAIIKCKMCGGDIELSADKTFGICDSCGSTMTFPKINDDQRAAAFNRGNHFRRIGEFDRALAVYEHIVQEDDTDAEAHWCCALCRFGIEYVEDPTTYEWLPTCHRASFDSFLEDVDYLAAVAYSDGITQRQYQKEAVKIAEVQRGILATSQSEEPFDVFICYKESDENGERTRDSAMAQDIYYQLTEQGRRVFFARITLEEKAGAQYEPYIFAALHSARVMVVVGTKPEHFNAAWVKNEWSRFLVLMRKDRSKLLLPCYRDMDPYDLPEQLSVLQSYDMSKIGFVQDLLRGIAKVLDAQRTTELVKETVVVQARGNAVPTALLKRGNMALEDGEWENANKYFDRALDLDAECAEAYVGRYLAENQAPDLETQIKRLINESKAPELETCKVVEDGAYIQAAVERYAIKDYLLPQQIEQMYYFKSDYQSAFAYYQKQYEDKKQAFDTDRYMSKALRFAKGETKAKLYGLRRQFFDALEAQVERARVEDETNIAKIREAYEAHLKKADAMAAEAHRLADEECVHRYQAICQRQEQAVEYRDFRYARDEFVAMEFYADCAERAKQCQAKMDEIKKVWIRQAAEKEKKKIRRMIALAGAGAVVVAILLVVTRVLIPSQNYKTAEELQMEGDYAGAIEKFAAAGKYRDAADRILETHYLYADALRMKGDYAGAIEEFAAAGKYQNAADWILEAYYDYAEELLDAGKKSMAAIAFERAVPYQDAAERSNALWNEIADRSVIGTGYRHTVGLKMDGTVVAIGDKWYDQCNVSDWRDIVAVSAEKNHTVGLKTDGTVIAVGSIWDDECDVSDWKDIVAISAGESYTVGLKADGTVVAVDDKGDRRYIVSDWRDIMAISAGGSYIMGLKTDGTVVAVDDKGYKKNNLFDWTDIVAISAGGSHMVGLKADGTVVAVGDNTLNQCDVSDWRDIVAISAGGAHTVGLKADGTVVAVGSNWADQRYLSDWRDIVAISAGKYHTVGLKADGTVVAVGDNEYRQCNVSGWTDIRLPNESALQKISKTYDH